MAVPCRTHELALRESGRLVAGIDEAGVGAIAGPIIAAAAVLPLRWHEGLEVVTDSKALSIEARCRARETLVRVPDLIWATGAVSPWRVDAIGASSAALEAMSIAAARLEKKIRRCGPTRDETISTFYLVDGERVPANLHGQAIVQGDRKEASIATASIFATAAHVSQPAPVRASR